MKTLIKKLVDSLLRPMGFELTRTNIPLNPQRLHQVEPQHFFDLFFSTVNPDTFFFVQIGAHDGSFVDPMHAYVKKYNLSGIMVEPQPDLFAALQTTYAEQKNVTFSDVAIATPDVVPTLYTIKDEYKEGEFEKRGTGIATLDRQQFEKALGYELKRREREEGTPVPDNYLDMIQETPVKTLTFADFVSTYNIDRIDYIQIDCEGYDFEIIKMIDFTTTTPMVINYESRHFSAADRTACEELLANHGYSLFRHGSDTCAFHIDRIGTLTNNRS